MSKINKVAVLGSGVMGSAIAAHIANSGTEVLLMDIVPKGEEDRNKLAKTAIEKLLKTDPAAFTHKRKAKLITPGNIEDDLEKLGEVDWIVEAVIEDLKIKQKVYNAIDKFRKKTSIISSNTSTIPLEHLTKGMSDAFQKDFLITHFFNPPRYMRLLELVTGKQTRKEVAEKIRKFCDLELGKGVVNCKDTPGFIANRIGIYWITIAVLEAINQKVPVEIADAVLSRPIGVPKTGVFGLLDLIGIDLMPLIAKEFKDTLPKDDSFLKIYNEPEIITKMIKDGYTGRKGKGGFYRLNKDGGKKVKEAICLETGEYKKAEKPKLECVEAARSGLQNLFGFNDIASKFAWSVVSETLRYAASLVPDISDDIVSIDEAMKLGYNWKYGPFELIDKLGHENTNGAMWLAEKLKAEKKNVPEILKTVGAEKFYKEDNTSKYYFSTSGKHQKISVDSDAWTLADKKRGQQPVLKNASAKLWDIGDGIACLEFTTKMNTIDPYTLELIMKAVEKVESEFKGLVIGNDGDNFCAGANIGFLLFSANTAAWKTIDNVIKQGQDTFMALKFAPFPVVTAVSGLALGGGCEIQLHSDAVQAHVETYTGLVEVGVGLIPGWGGCKEMILRHLESDSKHQLNIAQKGGMFVLSLKHAITGVDTAAIRHPIVTINTMPAVSKAFEYIATAKVAKSAEEAKDMLIMQSENCITMNRKRLLNDAKQKCLSLTRDYTPPEIAKIQLPGKTAEVALLMAVESFVKRGIATPHDETIAKKLAVVLSGGNTDVTEEINEQNLLDLEREIFMELIKTKPTLDRIEYMLDTGKPLRN